MLLISEIFGPTIQGEGPLIGEPSVFVRAGGCDYRCSWCDTPYAVLPEYKSDWVKLSCDDVLNRVRELAGPSPILISLSGGNPALQDFEPLISRGRDEGYRFALETQGTIARPWFSRLDNLVLSPKPPSSGNVTGLESVRHCLESAGSMARTALKFVVFDQHDFDYAYELSHALSGIPTFLQVGNSDGTPDSETSDTAVLLERYRDLIDMTLAKSWYEAHVLPQMHVLLWGNKRGV